MMDVIRYASRLAKLRKTLLVAGNFKGLIEQAKFHNHTDIAKRILSLVESLHCSSSKQLLLNKSRQ